MRAIFKDLPFCIIHTKKYKIAKKKINDLIKIINYPSRWLRRKKKLSYVANHKYFSDFSRYSFFANGDTIVNKRGRNFTRFSPLGSLFFSLCMCWLPWRKDGCSIRHKIIFYASSLENCSEVQHVWVENVTSNRYIKERSQADTFSVEKQVKRWSSWEPTIRTNI